MERPVVAACAAIFWSLGCSSCGPSAPPDMAACSQLSQKLERQGDAFVTRLQQIRQGHIELREYDRQMIAALKSRREELAGALFKSDTWREGVAGCTGKPLADLKRTAADERQRLQGFLTTFEKALREDPPGEFIDSR